MNSSSRRPPPRQVPPPQQDAVLSPHTRFIPREELVAYTSWAPGALGPAAQPASTQTLQTPVQRAGAPVTAQATAPQHAAARWAPDGTQTQEPRREPSVDLEGLQQAARQAGYHDGYRDGLAALENFKRSFAQQMATQIGHLMESIDREFQALEADMAQAVVHASTGLARQIVRSELATRPEFITHVARQAVAALSMSLRHIEMRVHPDDLALVQAGLGEEAQARGVTCVADPAVSRGGCTLQTELGSLDARIEHQWDQALRRTGQDATHWPLHSGDSRDLGDQF